MSYFPVCLDLEAKPCLVVGGGRVAARKVASLCACNARVTVVSPALEPALAAMVADGQVRHLARPFQTGDLDGAFLVIAATDDTAVQEQVYREAEARHQLVNVADVPSRCNFILPATVRHGDFTVSVSTGGGSPALARAIRQELEERFGPEYGVLTAILAMLRPVILAAANDPDANRPHFHRLADPRLAHWIRCRDWDRIKNHLATNCPVPIPAAVLDAAETLVCGSEGDATPE